MNWGYTYAIFSLASNVACQQLLSASLHQAGRSVRQGTGISESIRSLLGDGRFWIGGSLAALCLTLWALALTQLPIARALPIMSLIFVISPVVNSRITGTPLSIPMVAGFFLITLGVALTSFQATSGTRGGDGHQEPAPSTYHPND